jgi:hypothetical protein
MERLAGVTEIEWTVAFDTTRVTEPLMLTEARVAEIVVCPALTPVAVLLVMVAAPVLEEAHTTWLVMLRVLPSENVPTALY